MNEFSPGIGPPDSMANVSLTVGVVVAVVLLLLLLGAIVATGFCVVAYQKRRAVPNKSNPEPVYEEAQPVPATHYIMTPSTAYGVVKPPHAMVQSNPDDEEVQLVTATHYIMTPSTAYGVVKPPQL